jgi:hypothetical protein
MDCTALFFHIDPEPMVLPVDIRARFMGKRPSADKRWQELAGKTANRN